jgi:acyl-CoA thioesterase I
MAFRSMMLRIVAVCLAAIVMPSSGLAQEHTVTIVALGASNTAGWGVAPSEAYPARLQAVLRAKGVDAQVHNAGIPGDTTGGMLARLESAVPAGAQLVILQPGTNDERMGLSAERAANIEKMRIALDRRNIRLLVVENAVLDALPRSELRADGVHFTPAGYAMLAERILLPVLAALGR